MNSALNHLEQAGALEILPTGEAMPVAPDLTEAAAAAVELNERRHHFEQSRLAMMRGYAELHDCRRAYLLQYFGEPYDAPCGHCDQCEARATAAAADSATSSPESTTMAKSPSADVPVPFALNSRVTHEKWGEGLVMRAEGDKLTVLFDEVGYKTLDIIVVQENGLLQPVVSAQ